MDTIYQLLGFDLTPQGEKQLETHPDIPWGCKVPISEEEFNIHYPYRRSRREIRENKPKMTYMEYCKEMINSPHYSFKDDSCFHTTLGFFKNKNDFEDFFVVDNMRDKYIDYLSPYVRFILTPKGFGIFAMPKDNWEQVAYEYVDGKIVKLPELWTGFKAIYW